MSRFKELSRLRQQWLAATPALGSDPRFKTFSRRLMMVPEHTWGTDEKTFLGDHEHYSAAAFGSVRGRASFQRFQNSWVEKRAYPQEALNALEDLPQAQEAFAHLQAIRPAEPDLAQWTSLPDPVRERNLGGFNFSFDAATGALVSLKPQTAKLDWAAPGQPLAWLRYQTFSAQDYERFFHQYILPSAQNNDWAIEDFTKPGLERAAPQSRFWQPQARESFTRQTNNDTRFLFHLTADPRSAREYGCPRDFWLQYLFNPERPVVQVKLQWFHKSACRLPEAIWLSFIPPVACGDDWYIEKLGRELAPLDVVPDGNRHLHASGKYIRWNRQGSSLKIVSLDAPLVAPGRPSLLDFNNDLPQIEQGMHFNLLNNLWGTNFPMWFEEDCRFRFEISIESEAR